MQRLFVSLVSAALTIATLIAQAAGDTKAVELLAQARAAIGGEQRLSKVQGLSCTGTYQRTLQERQLSGEITIDLQLPDRMLRTETMNPMGEVTVITETGMNGDTLLRNQRSVNAPPGQVIRGGPATPRRRRSDPLTSAA